MLLLFDAAARVQEVLDLTGRGHRHHTRAGRVTLTGKGRKTRIVPIMDKPAGISTNTSHVFHPDPQHGEALLFFTIRAGRHGADEPGQHRPTYSTNTL